jgi:DTW domain-containing protein YfiP
MRIGARARCVRCRMHAELCLCAGLEPLRIRTRIVLATHPVERHKPTNTGNLVRLVLPSCEIRIAGRNDCPWDPTGLEGAWLLHPSGARELEVSDRPPALVVVDGTWRQAKRMLEREPTLAALPRVRLPPGWPGDFRIRTTRHPDRLSTLEAVARALIIIEGFDPGRALLDAQRRMVDRTLWSRGRLPASEVFGGVPDVAIAMRGR